MTHAVGFVGASRRSSFVGHKNLLSLVDAGAPFPVETLTDWQRAKLFEIWARAT